MKILAIDDNEDILQLLEKILTFEGHEFTSRGNGKDGLRAIREQKFDIVLLDLFMPDFSGFDVVDALFEDGLMDKQKVVLFTVASSIDKQVEGLLEKGAYCCIRKPVDVEELLSRINEIGTK